MNKKDKFYFNKLKREITVVFLKNHHASDLIEDWKGDEIILFQEDLFAKVKAKVSEKWFYNYFKNEPEKMPRIDMLNLLSEYVGHRNWNSFKETHNADIAGTATSVKKPTYFFIASICLLGLAWFGLNTDNEFQFCFVDDLLNEPIVKVPLDIKILNENESPISFKTDSLGCFVYTTPEEYIKFIVRSPYHKSDTIVRFIESSKNRNIQLTPDDYALMLKYYTEGNIEDWSEHKVQLQNLISDDAVIYKLYGNNMGVERYTKNDFVRLLTIPTSSLKRIKVLDRKLENGKIVKLKFVVQ